MKNENKDTKPKINVNSEAAEYRYGDSCGEEPLFVAYLPLEERQNVDAEYACSREQCTVRAAQNRRQQRTDENGNRNGMQVLDGKPRTPRVGRSAITQPTVP